MWIDAPKQNPNNNYFWIFFKNVFTPLKCMKQKVMSNLF